jgi:hypothetical protein
MSYLGARNAISLGVSYLTTLGGPNLLNKLSPSLLLNFAGATAIDPRITFTRSTTATFTGSNGLIQSAAINAARFDYNPTTLASLGLLIEEQRVNLLLQSQAFETGWSATDVSVTSNTTTAPDGTTTADTLAETAVTSIHTASQSSSSTGFLTLSVFAKLNSGTRFLTLGISSSGISHSSATFNLSLGTNTQTQVNGGNYASPSATITAVAQGFYRCTFTVTTTDTATLFRVGLNNTGTPTASNRSFGATYLGVVTNSIFIWGAQLEAGAFPTSYIPTVASQVTRAADVARISGANFTSFYNAAEGTVYFEAQTAQGSNAYPWSLFGTSTANRIFANYTTTDRMQSGIRVATVFEALVTTPNNSAPLNTFGKGATAYKVNDFGFSWNGAAALTDTSTTLPVVQQLDIGNNGALATNFLNGTIRQIVYYPRRLANAELRGITS